MHLALTVTPDFAHALSMRWRVGTGRQTFGFLVLSRAKALPPYPTGLLLKLLIVALWY